MSSILPAVGDRRSYDGALCTVRYVGEVAGTAAGGLWLGVEWDDATRGKHDGVHKGVRYFSCRPRTRPPPVVLVGGAPHPALTAPPPSTPASFVRPSRPFDTPRSFLEAVRQKYASEVLEEDATKADAPARQQIVISGKVAEEVGFDKVRRQLAQIETLRVVILDGQCVVSGHDLGAADASGREADSSLSAIRTACPSITELDLSRNLFTDVATVAAICRELPRLKGLRINGNRIAVGASPYVGAFAAVRELAVEETLLSWEEVGLLTASFPSLASLLAGSNELTQLLPPLPPASMAHLNTTLTTLNLEFNDFTALSDLASLSTLEALRTLHLKGCRIARVSQTEQKESAQAVPGFRFSEALTYIDLSYNLVTSWRFVDALPNVFPGMTSLRFAHNPIYNNPNLDTEAAPSSSASSAASTAATASSSAAASASTEESYMMVVGRLAHLRTLNFSTISATDRTNAELFYLSRIAKQMAAVAQDSPEERAVIARHRRYTELCAFYGEPAIVRHASINPAYLEARLVQVLFALADQTKTVSIPKSFDMYAVKAIAGRLFDRAPHKLRLVWETGEWDPVVGVDETEEEVEDEDDDDDDETMHVETNQPLAETEASGRWVKREVELKDTPRQFGFCVDGLEARIRVEVK
ncbi:hypothetical protein SEPCBS119000_003970 [Sporothrix epigloea]|uniref:CAP-Gly domain-containing protein n=1 Tax=Sporothrix epigloea TaxID=1892477 RepID=A0ABP0DSF8_9PEZI